MLVLRLSCFFILCFIHRYHAFQMPIFPPDAQVNDGDIYDFIVVGAGATGSTLTHRLTETNWNILQIEAGGDPSINSVRPGFVFKVPRTTQDWNYKTVNDKFSSQAQKIPGQCRYTKGKLLGGCCSLNHMYNMRGNPEDFQRYETHFGFEGWNWPTAFRYFLKNEGMQDEKTLQTSPYNKYHNSSGPIKVTRPLWDPLFQGKRNMLLKSFVELGFEENFDYNGPTQIGVAMPYFSLSKSGIRSSAAVRLLAPIRNRPNYFLMKHSVVTKVLIDETNTARGVEINSSGRIIRVFARVEVVLAAGAIGTPKILVSSGIGPKQDVLNLNVPLIKDLPVGLNMTDRFAVPFIIAGGQDLRTSNMTMPEDKFPIPNVIAYYSSTGSSRPDTQFIINYLGVQSPATKIIFDGFFNYDYSIVNTMTELNEKRELAVIYMILLRPKSRGKVKVVSTDPTVQPEIHTGYLSNREDIESVRNVYKMLMGLTETEYFKNVGGYIPYMGVPNCRGYDFLSDDYINCVIINAAAPMYHASGNCAMGVVVDSNMKVKGINKLRIIDASVIPELPSVNMNAPLIMIAEHTADLIKKEYGR